MNLTNLPKTEYPKISVIVPNFNYADYLEEAILSIINQNYSNIELIIIDGGSSDHSIQIIKKYEKQIHYWVSEPDKGQTDAINKGLKVCTGDYVCFLNSDDAYVGQTFISIFSDPKTQGVDFIYGDVFVGETLGQTNIIYGHKNQMLLSNLVLFFYNIEFIIPSQSVFIKRSFLMLNNLNWLNPQLNYCMDMDWYCRIAMASPLCYKYKLVSAFFRLHKNTKTKSQSEKMRNEAIQVALNYIPKLSVREQKRFFRLLFLSKVLRNVYQNKINVQPFLVFKLINKIGLTALSNKKIIGIYKKTFLSF